MRQTTDDTELKEVGGSKLVRKSLSQFSHWIKIIVTITLEKISVQRKLYPADRGGCEEEEASSCRGEHSHLYNVHTAWF